MIDTPFQRPRAGFAAALTCLLIVAGCASTAEKPEPEPSATMASKPAPAPAPKPAAVTPDVVRPSHPVRYIVRRGDTLWDIAAKFLRDPWVWPEIWSVNPQIENPHLIYPGDVITLAYVGGKPRLQVRRPGAPGEARPTGENVERLEPKVRERPLEEAIPSIPADAIQQFLTRPRVVSLDELHSAPYILGNYEGRLISAAGNDVFARGFPGGRPDASSYSIFRPGDPLVDPDTGETLGYEAIHVGKAAVRAYGPPSRLEITDSEREILKGDRLLPADREPVHARYVPTVPDQKVDGQIIKLFDAISQVATDQIVVINRGADDGMRTGTVLAIAQSGGTITDPYADNGPEEVQLPPQRVGTLMLFKVFDRLSYALIMDATHPVHLHDQVTNP